MAQHAAHPLLVFPNKAAYQDPGKHIGSFVRGIPLFAAVAALSAAVVTLL